RLGPAPLEDMLWEALKDPQCGLSMAETAESLAEKYKLTRRGVDEVAVSSQQRAKQAWDACAFQDEVVPVTIKVKGKEVEFRADEHMRPETTLEILSGLKPYFNKDDLVTAGNASGISDGGAATVIAGAEWAEALWARFRLHWRRPGRGGHPRGVMSDILVTAIGAIALYLFAGLRVLREYERGVYFLLGHLRPTKGPGLIFLPPLLAKMQKVSF